LFPATYFLPRHPSPTEVAAEMVRKFREEWQRIAPPEAQHDATGLERGRPVISVVTLASLVERETPKPEERPLVAGAFENRLRHNIALQCDPTVIYALQRCRAVQGQAHRRRSAFPVAIQHLCASRPASGPSAIPAKPLCAPHSIRQKRILIFCG